MNRTREQIAGDILDIALMMHPETQLKIADYVLKAIDDAIKGERAEGANWAMTHAVKAMCYGCKNDWPVLVRPDGYRSHKWPLGEMQECKSAPIFKAIDKGLPASTKDTP